MAKLLNPIFDREGCVELVKHRSTSFFQPIQRIPGRKESDWLAYLFTPLIDMFVLSYALAFDACVHLINVVASLIRALYLWIKNPRHSPDTIDPETRHELDLAWSHTLNMFAAILLFAYTASSFCTMSWGTRLIASVIHAIQNTPEMEETPQQEAPRHVWGEGQRLGGQ